MSLDDSPSAWLAAFGELDGRRALVTGASSGIGAAVAQALAECGAHVCMHHGRRAQAAATAAAELRRRGLSATTVSADLSIGGAARAMVSSAAASLGGLDLLVNIAGSPMGRAGIETLDDDVCAGILQLNLRAVVDSIGSALPYLRRATHPAIINTSSVAVRTGGGRGVAVYAAAKSAVESLTRSLARELAGDGIRVNCVAPGYIETPIHEGFSSDDDRRAYIAATPMARGGTEDDCVGAYLFLACHRLSGFITGQTIAVNGGLAFN
jgi:3-oxoacyl-[acyl-carrier protein] reductase